MDCITLSECMSMACIQLVAYVMASIKFLMFVYIGSTAPIIKCMSSVYMHRLMSCTYPQLLPRWQARMI